uniref:Clp1 P-loop domain-containing protein n=1 Tax=Desulfobacca acetoxidans TaxID=60893 RepID=A0A7V6DPF0_9BACT
MSSSSDPTFPFVKNLDIPAAWEDAAQRFLATDGLTMVLGGPDTGKSTLCQYLVYRSYVAGEPVGLVDLDLGQSHLGPPGTLGLGMFPPRFPGDRGLFPEGLYFIGQTSPVGALLEVAVGSRVLADQARAQGVNRLLVNTSGLVQGYAAHRLKQAEAELLQPHLLLGLDREGELNPLLHTLPQGQSTLLSLPVSVSARRRSFAERRRYREDRFRCYWEKSRPLDLSLSQVVWHGLPLGWGEPFSPADLDHWSKILGKQVLYGVAGDSRITLVMDQPPSCPHFLASQKHLHLLDCKTLEHHLAGLWDRSRHTLALGLLLPSPWRAGTIRIMTPWPASRSSEIKGISLGRLKMSLNGQEWPGSEFL